MTRKANTTTPAAAEKATPSIAFTPTTVLMNGHTFPAKYSLAKNGDVFAFVSLAADMRLTKMHFAMGDTYYEQAKTAAMVAKVTPEQPADKPAAPAKPAKASKPADKPAAPAKPAKASKPAEKPAAPAEYVGKHAAKASKPADKPAAPAKPAKASKPAATVVPMLSPADIANKAWVGTNITGANWSILFDDKADRTRVIFEGAPTDTQKRLVAEAGFYWSNSTKSFNKKLACKAYRAAIDLANKLNATA